MNKQEPFIITVSRFDARNYDIVLSADGHTEEQLADIILSYIG